MSDQNSSGDIVKRLIEKLLRESVTVVVLTLICYYFITRERELFQEYKSIKNQETEILLKTLEKRNQKIFELYERLSRQKSGD
jgi:hypothetical protein